MRGRVRATVLWEDQRGPTNNFGPHELLLALVYDVKDGDPHRLRKVIEGRQMKGDSKVLKSFREGGADIACDGRHLIAVFDDDRVRNLLHLRGDTTEAEVVEKIRKDATAPPDRSSIVLLKRNVETIIEAAGGCDPSLNPATLGKAKAKDRLARDQILTHVAWHSDRRVRDCVVEAVPSLAELRTVAIAALP